MTPKGTENQSVVQTRGRILVVDDKAANRTLLKHDLTENGFEVELAASGKECLEKARAWSPETIILDIEMPDMDGFETARALKEDSQISSIPILFVTAHDPDDSLTIEALDAGGNDFLQKPYPLPILVARVSTQVTIFRAQERLRQQVMSSEERLESRSCGAASPPTQQHRS